MSDLGPAARAALTPSYETVVEAARWDEREACISRLYAHAATLDEEGSRWMMLAVEILEAGR